MEVVRLVDFITVEGTEDDGIGVCAGALDHVGESIVVSDEIGIDDFRTLDLNDVPVKCCKVRFDFCLCSL